MFARRLQQSVQTAFWEAGRLNHQMAITHITEHFR